MPAGGFKLMQIIQEVVQIQLALSEKEMLGFMRGDLQLGFRLCLHRFIPMNGSSILSGGFLAM